jgi:hypothetical protein
VPAVSRIFPVLLEPTAAAGRDGRVDQYSEAAVGFLIRNFESFSARFHNSVNEFSRTSYWLCREFVQDNPTVL